MLSRGALGLGPGRTADTWRGQRTRRLLGITSDTDLAWLESGSRSEAASPADFSSRPLPRRRLTLPYSGDVDTGSK